MPTLQVYLTDAEYTELVEQAVRVDLSPGKVGRYRIALGESLSDEEIMAAMRWAMREQARSLTNKRRKVKTLV